MNATFCIYDIGVTSEATNKLPRFSSHMNYVTIAKHMKSKHNKTNGQGLHLSFAIN